MPSISLIILIMSKPRVNLSLTFSYINMYIFVGHHMRKCQDHILFEMVDKAKNSPKPCGYECGHSAGRNYD